VGLRPTVSKKIKSMNSIPLRIHISNSLYSMSLSTATRVNLALYEEIPSECHPSLRTHGLLISMTISSLHRCYLQTMRHWFLAADQIIGELGLNNERIQFRSQSIRRLLKCGVLRGKSNAGLPGERVPSFGINPSI
jgi:hypothetical protein